MKRTAKLVSTSLLIVSTFFANIANAALVDIDFTIDGNTWTQPWKLSNNSEPGLFIESFVFDLAPLLTYCYDIDDNDCRRSGGTPFAALSGAAATGFDNASVTSNSISGYYDHLQIDFNDFGTGEQFNWEIDVDSTANATVYGNELIGSDVSVVMSDGNTYIGHLVAVAGSPRASTFEITSVVSNSIPEPSTLAIFALGVIGLASRRVKK